MVFSANLKKNKKSSKVQEMSDDEKEARLDAVLGHISGNLNENLQYQEIDQIIDLSPVHRKKKNKLCQESKERKASEKAKNPFQSCFTMKGIFWNREVSLTWLSIDFWLIWLRKSKLIS